MWSIGRWLVIVATGMESAIPLRAEAKLVIEPSQCVFRAGDDLDWAKPDVDQSKWQPVSAWIDGPTEDAHFWLRCKLDSSVLEPGVRPVLQIAANAAYEVFLNGGMLARFGNVNTGAHTEGMVNQYDSPALSGKPVDLAIRIAYMPTVYGEQPLPWISVGDATLMRTQYEANTWQRLRSHWIIWVCNGLMATAGLFFIALFFFDRSQRVLLWAALTWVGLATIRFAEFLVAASVHFPSRLEYLLYAIGNCDQIFYILFFFALTRRPLSALFRVLLWFQVIYSGLLLMIPLLPLQAATIFRYWMEGWPAGQDVIIPLYLMTSLAPLAAFWPINKLPRSQLLLYAVCSFWMGMEVLYFGSQVPLLGFGQFYFLTFQTVRSMAIAAVVVAMTLLLIQRIRNTNRERAALAAEVRAAQEIQRILVPRVSESAPGLSIDAVFLPALEVGGDFYRFRVLEDGTQWILLGDVSGKGTAAGMTGAMLLGASEGHVEERPAALLEHLNRVLCNSQVGGFATCLCARIEKNGSVVVANAGHLPPYLDMQEVELENGLPLGVTRAATYVEDSLQLPIGGALTFLSDGVVEAQNAKGELFGFDRTRALSSKAAEEIAQEAQCFGQHDDITVVRVRLVGYPELP